MIESRDPRSPLHFEQNEYVDDFSIINYSIYFTFPTIFKQINHRNNNNINFYLQQKKFWWYLCIYIVLYTIENVTCKIEKVRKQQKYVCSSRKTVLFSLVLLLVVVAVRHNFCFRKLCWKKLNQANIYQFFLKILYSFSV